ncbi:hypothetical protein KGM_211924 [Danaus plexippus plexippus]|uniref:Uncharacterized protein n=1 Tax=Danaus plexippus plexippus TaxID=278856 RepID=A0A212ETN6_DANPL|nr:hypothetical protein KGM_211924 [Danaus plexippus plexippus]
MFVEARIVGKRKGGSIGAIASNCERNVRATGVGLRLPLDVVWDGMRWLCVVGAGGGHWWLRNPQHFLKVAQANVGRQAFRATFVIRCVDSPPRRK